MHDADARRMHDGLWQVLREPGDASPWREEVEEYTGDSGGFEQRHYNEFVSFLPYVQRFLYGEGRSHKLSEGSASHYGDSPMRIFRRRDIAAVRVVARGGGVRSSCTPHCYRRLATHEHATYLIAACAYV